LAGFSTALAEAVDFLAAAVLAEAAGAGFAGEAGDFVTGSSFPKCVIHRQGIDSVTHGCLLLDRPGGQKGNLDKLALLRQARGL
jgi:hypothetical protein